MLGFFIFGLAGMAAAQQGDPDYYGLATNYYYVAAEEFNCSDPTGNCSYRECGDHLWCDPADFVDIYAPVRLPTGAQVQGYRVIYNDSSAGNFSVRFYRSYYNISNGTAGRSEIQSWVSSGTPGITTSWVNIDPDITIQYRLETAVFSFFNNYYLWVTLYPSSNVALRGVIVYWNRQVSPAPASATFSDVPTGHPYFQFVEALVESGITAGCGGGNYCPDDPLTRGQMAVFLSAALGLHWAP
jgi:hypothetical protein